jgi:hypothetical protein
MEETKNVIGDAMDAWQYLCEHEIFQKKIDGFGISKFKSKCLDIAIEKVNPATDSIDDDSSLNTKIEVWLECGPYEEEYDNGMHDVDLDCGADTFEEAIIVLANLVYAKYDH